MPFKNNLSFEQKLGNYEKIEADCDGEANYFPKRAWKEIANKLMQHNRVCLGLEVFLVKNLATKDAVHRAAALRCALYKSMTVFVQAYRVNRQTGQKVCPPVCVQKEYVPNKLKSRRVDKLANGD